MLERYFVQPETIDRVRSSWIAGAIERYVAWLSDERYAARTVCRRVPILMQFGDFARDSGATTLQDLPYHVDAFVSSCVATRCAGKTETRRKDVAKAMRGPIEQMLRLVLGFSDRKPSRQPENPFEEQGAGFFQYLRDERGLRETSIRGYSHHLRAFAGYLKKIAINDLRHLSPPVFGGFFIELRQRVSCSSLRGACTALHVFLRYLHRERIIPKDISAAVDRPQAYRLSKIPRSVTWDEVRRMLEAVDRRTRLGKRDYAILLLLVTYGLRAREVAALTLDDIDWRNDRLRVPERKAGHSTGYPLSPTVGRALLDYLRHGRPNANDRHVFFRVVAPQAPLTYVAISGRATHYLRKAGIPVSRAGSHTLRHTCVQRLVDAEFSLKSIGDYVGHSAMRSTEVYAKVDIETLREVACGDGEDIL